MLLLTLNAALAGPWVKDPGQAYVKASTSVFTALQFVDPLSGEQLEQDYVGTNTSVYAEVGVARGLHLQAMLPYVTGRTYDTATSWRYRSAGLGDAQVGVVADVPGLELPASLTVLARLPLYDQSSLLPNAPALGDENVDVDVLAAVGHSLPLGPHWLWGSASAGFRWRAAWAPSGRTTPDYANTVPLTLQLGIAPMRGERSLGWVSLDGSSWIPLAQDEITRAQHQVGLGVAVNTVAGVHVEANGAWIPLARNASTGWSVGGGLSWKR